MARIAVEYAGVRVVCSYSAGERQLVQHGFPKAMRMSPPEVHEDFQVLTFELVDRKTWNGERGDEDPTSERLRRFVIEEREHLKELARKEWERS